MPGPRAREVLVLVLAGHDSAKIAKELGLSRSTVRQIRHHLNMAGLIPKKGT